MAMRSDQPIYKLVPRALWEDAVSQGVFNGAPVDHADGYIHFSDGAQICETAARHFAGVQDLLLLTVDTGGLGDALRWEPSRGGALFPHLYAPLALTAVLSVRELPLSADGSHRFPEDLR